MSKHGFILEHVEDVRDSINASKMKERFDMDIDEKHSGIKAAVFQMGYPVIRILPADKAVFVFQYAHPQKQKMILINQLLIFLKKVEIKVKAVKKVIFLIMN